MSTSSVSRPEVTALLHAQLQPRTFPRYWHSRPLKPGLPASMSAAITSYTSSSPALTRQFRCWLCFGPSL